MIVFFEGDVGGAGEDDVDEEAIAVPEEDAGVTLRVEGMRVPDSKLACEAAGKLLWDNEEKLKCCLSRSGVL